MQSFWAFYTPLPMVAKIIVLAGLGVMVWRIVKEWRTALGICICLVLLWLILEFLSHYHP
jgi:hypothetical protein